ncbi:MAG: TolC family protein [bacterium]
MDGYEPSQRIKQEVKKEVREAWNSLESAKKRIQIMKENVSLAEENLKIAQLQYKLGMITINEVADCQLTLKKTSTKYIGALIDWQIAKARLQKAVGKDEL